MTNEEFKDYQIKKLHEESVLQRKHTSIDFACMKINSVIHHLEKREKHPITPERAVNYLKDVQKILMEI
jgi:hypothetical protein